MTFENGIMTILNDNGDIVYKGQYASNGETGFARGGEGKEYDGKRLVYSGGWKKNKKSRKGKYYCDNGDLKYEWNDDKPHGK